MTEICVPIFIPWRSLAARHYLGFFEGPAEIIGTAEPWPMEEPPPSPSVITRAPQLPSGFYIDPDALDRCGTAVSQWFVSAGFDFGGAVSGAAKELGAITWNVGKSLYFSVKAAVRNGTGASAKNEAIAAGMTGRAAAGQAGAFVAGGLPPDVAAEGTSALLFGEINWKNLIPFYSSIHGARVEVPEACGR